MDTSTDDNVPDCLAHREAEKYRSNPKWAQAFDAAFDAAASVDAALWEARSFATIAAELVVAGKPMLVASSEEADRQATDALLRQLRATETAPAPEADAEPDHAQAALARAVAALNSGRGGTPTATETAADTRAGRAHAATGQEQGEAHQPDATAAAFAKATASINARR